MKIAYPFPLYHAEYANGLCTCFALGVPHNATPEQMIAHGRRLAIGHAQPETVLIHGKVVSFAELPAERVSTLAEQTWRPVLGSRLVKGRVEDRREATGGFHRDHMGPIAAAKPKRVTKKDWQGVLSKLLEQAGNGGLEPATVSRAQALLAA